MSRQELLEGLKRYKSRYPGESEVVAKFEELLMTHDDCFERTCLVGHITASSWIVAGERALLTHHRKLGNWLQLGGHCDGDSNVLRSAMREAEEESGLASLAPVTKEIFDIDVHVIPARRDEPEHLHYDIRFLLHHTGEGEFVVSDESLDLQWFTYSQLQELSLDDGVRRMADKWRASEIGQG